jgi:UDP-glucuronate 4-epimerase
MAYWKFANAIMNETPITLYDGVVRDFTYCDDVAIAVEKLLHKPNGHQIFNVGNSSPVPVKDMISLLEDYLGKRAIIQIADLPDTEPMITSCDNAKLQQAINYVPSTTLADGMRVFVDWYLKERS